ncbi:alpha-amylase family protein [Novilysobacter defluvii]|uniref:Glycosidase n=2 Tax=Novilysobacter TaxID=3382699 RepID=A0A0A0M6K4_9GAMM|nr:alpha-amylase family protein [Lysobacter defluvii]KGO97824.1 glycosidase [Lysobacter defluvii IMMIB APB-9 = DSM 18482]
MPGDHVHHADSVIYQIDPALYLDSNGDGWGDLPGITRRLDYIRSLGVSTVWLLPFYRTPYRDHGYDVSDHLSVDPRFGDIADFVALMERAEQLGLRVLVELVVQHTSDQHPWFQEARRDRNSRYRDWFIWADEPVDMGVEPMFPPEQDSVWTWDEEAGQYYRHTFYPHQPDLDLANPEVRREVYRIMAFWLRLGVAGFRVDAVPHMLERSRAANPEHDGFWLLDDMHRFAWTRSPGAILMGEADVEAEQYPRYFGGGGRADRLTHLLDFAINNRLFLSLARQEGAPLEEALTSHQPGGPRTRQAMWLRNHDELDLGQLTGAERGEVMRAFAPDESMRIYNRGIRRRLAPMLDGDPDRLAMSYALLLSLPGTPVLRYGDEIGMGEDLSLEERNALRTPMQWDAGPNGGFSTAAAGDLAAPLVADGRFGFQQVNVEDQAWRPGSLLDRIRRMIQVRLALHEIAGDCRTARHDCPGVFGLRYDGEDSSLLALVNLTGEPQQVRVREDDLRGELVDVLFDAPYRGCDAAALRLNPWGYRWLRRRQQPVDAT